ncbi:MAG: hypothetical protein MR799_03350 [Lachnospiraceae bacterium]|nr:hypothetical protein [Lachnospiraceae bacterium]
MKVAIIIGIVLLVLVAVMLVLYFVGQKMQKKQMEQKEMINAAATPMTMFIIKKEILPMKDANLPKAVFEQGGKQAKRMAKAKIPVIKAKVGPQIMTLICDESIYADVPPHGEIKGMVSGIYLTQVKALHKGAKKALEASQFDENGKKKKKSVREKMLERQAKYQQQLDYEIANKKAQKDKKAAKAAEKKKADRAKKISDSF